MEVIDGLYCFGDLDDFLVGVEKLEGIGGGHEGVVDEGEIGFMRKNILIEESFKVLFDGVEYFLVIVLTR